MEQKYEINCSADQTVNAADKLAAAREIKNLALAS